MASHAQQGGSALWEETGKGRMTDLLTTALVLSILRFGICFANYLGR
jgi:hypothetical protein